LVWRLRACPNIAAVTNAPRPKSISPISIPLAEFSVEAGRASMSMKSTAAANKGSVCIGGTGIAQLVAIR
jgi:hypothetical protein